MITSYSVDGFKCFGESQFVRFAPITLVFGPNSVGKSSIIQTLLLLKQTYLSNNIISLTAKGTSTDLGSFKSMLFRHDVRNRSLTVGLGYKIPVSQRVRQYYLPTDSVDERWLELKYSCPNSRGRNAAGELLSHMVYGYQNLEGKSLGFSLAFERGPGDGGGDVFKLLDTRSIEEFAEFLTQKKLSEITSISLSKDGVKRLLKANFFELSNLRLIPTEQTKGAYVVARRTGQIVDILNRDLYNYLSKLRYLGPLRMQPRRYYVAEGSSTNSVGTRGESTAEMLFAGKSTILKQIEKWFDDFEIPYRIRVRGAGDTVTGKIIVLEFVDKYGQVSISPTDVGFGIAQLLPILVEGVLARENIICLEQPEIHLHPRLQAHLTDFFIHTSVKGRTNRSKPQLNQWIIETHSESLMLRMQRRIREKVIASRDVCVLYVAENGEAGSRIMELRLDDDGEFIDEWPDGFFDESYQEIFGK